MNRFFDADSSFSLFLGRVSDIVFLNVLTLICCLPVVTIGAAVTALYDTVGRMQMDEGGLYAGYFRAFARNFKQSTVMWVLFLIVAGSMVYNFTLGAMLPVLVGALALVVFVVILSWALPMLATFRMSNKVILRNTVLCALGYLPRTIAMAVLNLLPWVVLVLSPYAFLRAGVLWACIYFALAVYLDLLLLKKPFAKLAESQEEE